MGIIGDIVDATTSAAGGVVDAVSDGAGIVVDTVSQTGQGVVNTVTNATNGTVFDPLVDAAGGVINTGIDAAGNVANASISIANRMAHGQINFVQGVGNVAAHVMDPMIDFVGRQLNNLGGALSNLWSRATSWLGGLVEALMKKFVEALEWACKGLTALVEQLKKLFVQLYEGMMAPKSLEAMAAMWADGPVKQLSGLSETISAQAMLADDGWSTPTGQAYSAAIPQQVAAVKALEVLSTDTSKSLKEAAASLKTLYAEGGGLLGRVCAALNGSPGSLFSIEALLDVFDGELKDLYDLVQAVKKFSEQMTAQKQKMAAQLSQNAAFPGGNWPRVILA